MAHQALVEVWEANLGGLSIRFNFLMVADSTGYNLCLLVISWLGCSLVTQLERNATCSLHVFASYDGDKPSHGKSHCNTFEVCALAG